MNLYRKTCRCARRSLSAATDAIGLYVFIVNLYELQVPSRDCTPRALPRASRSGRHVGLRPPRNDKSGCLAPLNYCCNTRNCLRRSLSAATDAIGAHHANDSLYQFAGAAPSVAHPRIHAKTGADGVRSRLLCSFTDCCAASSSGAFWLRDPVHACGCAGSAA